MKLGDPCACGGVLDEQRGVYLKSRGKGFLALGCSRCRNWFNVDGSEVIGDGRPMLNESMDKVGAYEQHS